MYLHRYATNFETLVVSDIVKHKIETIEQNY